MCGVHSKTWGLRHGTQRPSMSAWLSSVVLAFCCLWDGFVKNVLKALNIPPLLPTVCGIPADTRPPCPLVLEMGLYSNKLARASGVYFCTVLCP
mmetsp:Transcript_129281/g.288311  ORF Transcript_129281/g.288311 Transcript_129281/m.288311 type:complete len:94 (-) Transcript_129281:1900-2181(-)